VKAQWELNAILSSYWVTILFFYWVFIETWILPVIGTQKQVPRRPPRARMQSPQLAYIWYVLHLSRFFCAKWRAGRNVVMRSGLRRIQSDWTMPLCKFSANAKAPTKNSPKISHEAFCRAHSRWFVAKEQLPASGQNTLRPRCRTLQSRIKSSFSHVHSLTLVLQLSLSLLGLCYRNR
jgi:hypothetical protein